jgi:DNA-binding GntR family transcriptional regulator
MLRPRKTVTAPRRVSAPPTPVNVLVSIPAHRTLETLAYQDIRRAIADGKLAPGQRIVAQTIAKSAGISRIPVLQALRRLESEGFVRIAPHKDVVVAGLSPDDFRERFLLMAALESLCIREATGKVTGALLRRLRRLQQEMTLARKSKNAQRAVAADGEFHAILWRSSGLIQTVSILQNLWDRGEYYRIIMHARRRGFAEESLAEHEEILRALEQKDMAGAAQALERHRLQAMRRLSETT